MPRYYGPTVPMYELTVIDPELAGLTAGETVRVCVDCYGQATPDQLDGLHDEQRQVEVEPQRCLFCGQTPYYYDAVEANARDARPECP